MGRRLRDRRPARLPLALLGMVGLVILVEAALARYDWGFRNQQGLRWRFRDRAARREAPKAQVLCLGDSLLQCAIVPEVIEARLGLPTYNLALPGGPPPVSYFLLRHALDSGAKPRAILVDFIAHLLDRSPRAFEQVLPQVANLRECFDLAWSTRDSDFMATLALGRLLPSYRDRQGVRVRVANMLGRRTEEQEEEAGDLAAREARVYDPLIYPDAWQCSGVNASYVRRFLNLAAGHDIPVFWILPPFRDEALSRRERSGLEASYTAFVRSVQAEYPTLTVIDGRQQGGTGSTHLDPIHLSPSGASAFSSAVANVLARRLSEGPSGPKWVELRPAIDPDREPSPITRLSHSPAR
jgi:hypothetical protein